MTPNRKPHFCFAFSVWVKSPQLSTTRLIPTGPTAYLPSPKSLQSHWITHKNRVFAHFHSAMHYVSLQVSINVLSCVIFFFLFGVCVLLFLLPIVHIECSVAATRVAMIGWFSRLMKPNFIIFDTDTQLFFVNACLNGNIINATKNLLLLPFLCIDGPFSVGHSTAFYI